MPVASIALLFVAGGLLLIALSCGTRVRGRQIHGLGVAMAVMTGLALGFLSLFLFLFPFVVFPLGIAGILIARWLAAGRLTELGAFLVAAAGFWVLEEAAALINDLNDPAVTSPAWSPIPLALATGLMVFGATLIIGQRLTNRS